MPSRPGLRQCPERRVPVRGRAVNTTTDNSSNDNTTITTNDDTYTLHHDRYLHNYQLYELMLRPGAPRGRSRRAPPRRAAPSPGRILATRALVDETMATICVYIYIYVCMYVCMYVCIYIYISLSLYIYIYIYIYMYAYYIHNVALLWLIYFSDLGAFAGKDPGGRDKG